MPADATTATEQQTRLAGGRREEKDQRKWAGPTAFGNRIRI